LKADVYHDIPTTKKDMRERIKRSCAVVDTIQCIMQSMARIQTQLF